MIILRQNAIPVAFLKKTPRKYYYLESKGIPGYIPGMMPGCPKNMIMSRSWGFRISFPIKVCFKKIKSSLWQIGVKKQNSVTSYHL